MRQGGRGIGAEFYRVHEMAARWGVQEAIANAAGSGSSLHLVHLNSSGRGAIPVVLDMIAGARKRGIDVTTEAYPQTVGSTFIESAIFEGGWQQSMQISDNGLQWQTTGERLGKETFEKSRKEGGIGIEPAKQKMVTHNAMEFTGVYWIPVWHMPEDRAVRLLSANPQQLKVPQGRKSDAKGVAEYLQDERVDGGFVRSAETGTPSDPGIAEEERGQAVVGSFELEGAPGGGDAALSLRVLAAR